MTADSERQDRPWTLSEGARRALTKCLGPEQAAAFAAVFEAVAAHRPSAAELRRTTKLRRKAQRAVHLLKQFMECVAQDGVEDALRTGSDLSQEEWAAWQSTTPRIGRELPRPSRGRPIDHDREMAGMLVGFAFKVLNLPASRSRDGTFATTCGITLKALGHRLAKDWNDPRLLVHYDRAGRMLLVKLKANENVRQILATTTAPDGMGGRRLAFEHLLDIAPRQRSVRFRKK